MYQRTRQTFVICFATVATASLAFAAGPKANPGAAVAATLPVNTTIVEIVDLQPFTNVAYIPMGADLSSIRFQGAKTVKVATKRTYTEDRHYCGQDFREPGGSAFCPQSQDGSPMAAYQVTYSFNGPSMASDEYGNTRQTFSVYFHEDALPPAVRERMSAPKLPRAEAEQLLKVTTSRSNARQVSIDERNSSFCAGNYRDGLWTRLDANCQDTVVYETVTEPSGYLMVRVDPASAGIER